MSEATANLMRLSDLGELASLSRGKVRAIAREGLLGGGPLWPRGRRFYLREVGRVVLCGAPFSRCGLFGAEPEPELLRVREVLDWTGLTEEQFRWAEQHVARERPELVFQPYAGGKKRYRKCLVRACFFEPLVPGALRAELGKLIVQS